jgi:hypothetical protein
MEEPMIWSLIGCILLNSGKIELGTTETTETTDCEETTVYQDLDGDGYGGSEEFNLCNTEGYISVGGDCNDNDAQIHPEASEICDEIDNDCDQLIDDNDNDLITNQPVYEDNDGDGYGGTQEYFFCTPPNTYVGNANDCDDNDEASTNRLIDNDCDQSQNEIGCITIDVEDNQTTDNSDPVNRILIYENVPFSDNTPMHVGSFLMNSDNEYCSFASILTLQYETLEPFPQSEVEFTLYRNSTELLGQGVTSVQGGVNFEDEYYYDGVDLLIIGEDCDDDDEDLTDIVNDLDCDGVFGVEDCDDQDPTSETVSEDHDCDGLSNTQDLIFDGDYWIDSNESQLKLDRIQSYQEINGDLYIQESTITELQFSNLISVDNILIEKNSGIKEITGFNALSEVNNLIIKSNETLTNLQGFSGLDRIDGTLQIINNDVLAQITFLNITYIDSLWLTNNPSLTIDQVSFLSDSSNVTISSCYSAIGWCPEISSEGSN